MNEWLARPVGLVLPRKAPLFAPSDQTARRSLWLDAYLKLDQKKEEREICMLFVRLLWAGGLLCGASGPARLLNTGVWIITGVIYLVGGLLFHWDMIIEKYLILLYQNQRR